MADVIKKFKNNTAILAGKITEITQKREGDDKNGKHYTSFKGTIQCGEETVMTRNFEVFCYALTSKGKVNKNYAAFNNLLEEYEAKQKKDEDEDEDEDKDDSVMVELSGSISDNTYVNASNELKEGLKFGMNHVEKFTDYKCDLELDAYVQNISDEIDANDKETGRKRMTLMLMDFSKNPVVIKAVVRKEDIDNVEGCGYDEAGVFGNKIALSYIPHEDVQESKGGWGKKVTKGHSYTELTVVGCEPASEIPDDGGSEEILDADGVKNLLYARKEYTKEKKDAGYQGNKENGSSATTSAKTSAKTSAATSSKKSTKAKKVEEDEEDDLPF